MEIICPNCGKLYLVYGHFFGKICTKCSEEILPLEEMDIVKKIKKKDNELKEKALRSLIDKMSLEDRSNNND